MTTAKRTDRRALWVLVLASVASLMVALDALVVTTALPTIRLRLGASIEELEWTVNAYALSFAVLLLTGAAIGDRYGRRRMFAVGLGIFSCASVACALAPSVGLLIAARAVQGAGAALIAPLGLALLGVAFAPERRAWALGIFSAITGLAVLGGPVIGGAITQGIAWEWIFWINVPIGLISIPLVLTRIPESRGPRSRPDVAGLLLASAGTLGIVWGLVRGNDAGWGSPEVLGALVCGVALTAAFIAWERRVSAPMLPLELFASRAFSAATASVFFQFAALSGAVFFMAQFLQTAQGQGPLEAGLRLLPWTATLFFVAPIAGRSIGIVGERPLAATGLALQGVAMAWIAAVASPTVAYVELVPPLAIAGIGVSMAIVAIQNAMLAAVAPEHLAKASGAFSTMRQLGGVFGIAIVAAAFTGAGGYADPSTFSDGFTAAIAVAGALSLVGALAGLAIPARARTRPVVSSSAAPSSARA